MSSPGRPVRIVLITGYLGAGKTTLVNRILANDLGIRAAVIVNDIGEVNVDADLIAGGGLVEQDDIIPLTNGCICCTLADDLAAQLREFAGSGAFDYVIIEASGICEPIPIAYTISAFCDEETHAGAAPMALDNIVSVIDCARMFDEFGGGSDLLADDIDEDDIESLLVQQIEFCTTLVLNKADAVTPEQMRELRAIVRSLQRDAVIVEATQADVPLSEILDTGRFNFVDAYNSAAWIDAMEHPEEHEDPEVLEYDIETFLYERRRPFDLAAFQDVVGAWPRSVIRCKGLVWQSGNPDMAYLFEQSGRQLRMGENGWFIASAPLDKQRELLDENPQIKDLWDEKVGDRRTQLVVIGRHMDRDAIVAGLDGCLAEDLPEMGEILDLCGPVDDSIPTEGASPAKNSSPAENSSPTEGPVEKIRLGTHGEDYGSWMSTPVFYFAGGLAVAAAVLSALAFKVAHIGVLGVILAIATIALLAVICWMAWIRREYSFTGGHKMEQVHETILDHMEWDGDGDLLDVGCGSGALSIRCALAYPRARVTGVDYWGSVYAYGKEQCERNAALEGVGERCAFVHGDARRLELADESFDAVVSNYVYHNITGTDKLALVRETLRVLKKGGCFALNDSMDKGHGYPDMEAFAQALLDEGFEEARVVDTASEVFGGATGAALHMLSGSKLLVGRK